jgi:glycosyltransferase involved in cell wall biosynthesis
MIILSILIPTIPERVDLFTGLYNELNAQIHMMESTHPSLPTVEILVDPSVRFLEGGPSIGLKRNNLVQRAKGQYVCFVDDDDAIAPNYIESLVRLCMQGADIVTFQASVRMKSFWSLVDMRLSYKVNDQLNPDYTARRPPWHCCPVRTSFAKAHKFKNLNNAEDFDWMQRVLGQCTTEIHTDKILFEYRHGDHSEADQIPLP